MNDHNHPHTPKPLNERAMLVRLTIHKPTTTKRDAHAESCIQSALHDNGLKVSSTLFRERTSPVRQLLNAVSAVYQYHKTHTLPYEDRGPRLLPVDRYEKYRDDMRKLIDEVDTTRRQVMPEYDNHVLTDIALRGSRAKVEDYPTKDDFDAALNIDFRFRPLPDSSHFLFDVNPEDLAMMRAEADEMARQVKDDLLTRLRAPLMQLIDKLAIPAGTPGAIFRDTKVTNVTEAAALVKELAMGDAEVINAADAILAAATPIAANPHTLRESPEIRESARARLAAVAATMNFMSGPDTEPDDTP